MHFSYKCNKIIYRTSASGTGEEAAKTFLNDFQGGKIDDIHHKRLFELLKEYFVIGGMPEAVTLFVENREQPLNAFRAVRQLQRQLLLHYERDFSKGYRSYEDLADPIAWVIKAGFSLKVNTNEHPSSPIMAGAKENSFKLKFPA